MPDKAPTIVPGTPTITQPSTGPVTPPAQEPVKDTSPGIDVVQKVFDRIMPPGKDAKPPASATPPVTEPPPAIPPPPVEPPKEPVKPAEEPKPPVEHKMPSFLEEALKVEPSQPEKPAAPPEEEWPEELPTFKSSDEAKNRYKKWRESYKTLKEEAKSLRERPGGLDEQTKARMDMLEGQNKEMATVLSRFGVEQSAEFQQNVIRPLYGAWNEACRIVKESGLDPNDLARAMSLGGKTQFEALDQLFEGMPESAKSEVHDALRAYRKLEDVRRSALANAPANFEQIRKREMEREYAVLNKQKEEMASMFDDAIKQLRDEAKVEVLQTTTDPEAGWWNDQQKELIATSRKLYLENTDMRKMAMACVLAPMADTYRKLWLTERAARNKAEKNLQEKFGAEPSLSESPGATTPSQEAQMKEDLKRPFSEVFLREFHRAQARSR